MAGWQGNAPPLQPSPPAAPRAGTAGAAPIGSALFCVGLKKCLAASGGSLNLSQLNATWFKVLGEPLVPQRFGAWSLSNLLFEVRLAQGFALKSLCACKHAAPGLTPASVR